MIGTPASPRKCSATMPAACRCRPDLKMGTKLTDDRRRDQRPKGRTFVIIALGMQPPSQEKADKHAKAVYCALEPE